MGDSGGSLWKTDTPAGETESISTVLGVASYIPSNKCGDLSIAHKVGHKDILMWISQNWEQ